MNWLKYKKIYFIFSLILILIGFYSLKNWGLKLGVDFKGGSVIEYRFAVPVSTEEITKALEGKSIDVSSIQTTEDGSYFIKLPLLEEGDRDKIASVAAQIVTGENKEDNRQQWKRVHGREHPLDDRRVRRVELVDAIDPDFVLERIIRFGQRQEMRLSLGKMIDLLDNDEDFDKARTLLEKALCVGASRKEGIELFDGVDRIEEFSQESPYSKERIPTGIPALDEALRGGVGGPQLGVIQAPPKTGKSTTLVNFGTNAMLYLASNGAPVKNVLHISFELYEEDLLFMYLARLTGLTRDDCSKEYTTVRELWNGVHSAVLPGQLRIKYFSPWSLTTGGLRDYLGRLRAAHGWSPRTIILDYADRMRVNLENTYRAYGQLYDELIALANDFGCNIWTATQANRSGYQSEKGASNQASDSWLKVANADIYMPISQTREERASRTMRLYAEFIRRGEDGFEVPCQIDYARATVKQSGDPVRS